MQPHPDQATGRGVVSSKRKAESRKAAKSGGYGGTAVQNLSFGGIGENEVIADK